MNYSDFCYLDKSGKIGSVNIILNLYQKHNCEQYNKLIAHIVKICTEAWLYSQNNGIDMFDVTVNASDISLKKLDRKLAKQLAITLQNLFPEKLHKCTIYNTPNIFYHFYDIIKIFIDKKTRNKITIMKKPKLDDPDCFDHNSLILK
jgi:hypothetical protein